MTRVLWRCARPTIGPGAAHHRLAPVPRLGHTLAARSGAKAIRADFPEYTAIHCHVLPDVLARLDTTYQAFFRRVANGELPGFPRFQGRTRWPPSPTRSTAMAPPG